MKPAFQKILNYIDKLKKTNGFSIIDTHVHPYDVMGAVHFNDGRHHDVLGIGNNFSGGVLELFKFGKIVNLISPLYYRIFPGSVFSIIHDTFKNAGPELILREMDQSLIDMCTLVPIEPWLTTKFVYDNFKSERFLLLGSFDINGDSLEDIKQKFDVYIRDYKIIGLKLHPNLQNFKPQPSDNSESVRKKLEYIYSRASEEKLYLLFHGGRSFYTEKVSKKYGIIKRSRNSALLKNFYKDDGSSEIFGKYDIPIIFAHLGNFGLLRSDYEELKILNKKFKDIYFDTAGCSPYLISKVLEIVGPKKIIFGSDGLYNRMLYNMVFVYQGVQRARKNKSDLSDDLMNILGMNYNNFLWNG